MCIYMICIYIYAYGCSCDPPFELLQQLKALANTLNKHGHDDDATRA